ncbi:protein of unknown function [Candidatus Nitrospira inopinata]|uniref:Uncharacterized protein n=1 Tax=Candidatus Nitrospira inopinata TaxID=1715989 RepID=A0A0S4KT90_9BACT|nr:protein of unknown function [Candidatus Nitrospira inopinata]
MAPKPQLELTWIGKENRPVCVRTCLSEQGRHAQAGRSWACLRRAFGRQVRRSRTR